ncbi:hypothetical protein QYF36_026206 [Acer negundo]|nr:hypothetical protein QYF36_026206 [Acer negundo]
MELLCIHLLWFHGGSEDDFAYARSRSDKEEGEEYVNKLKIPFNPHVNQSYVDVVKNSKLRGQEFMPDQSEGVLSMS